MTTHRRLEETRASRLSKLQHLQQQGVDAYPATTADHQLVVEVLELVAKKSDRPATIVGRLLTTRLHGKSLFADLRDRSGSIQLFLNVEHLGQKLYESFVSSIDNGDFVQVTGTPYLTKRGEKSLLVSQWRLLSKSLQPLPEKFHGLTDSELRSRKREQDLLANDDSRQRFQRRSAIVQSIRRQLEANDFLEVETPILQPIPGGANATPFVTRHEELDADFYLRIAPELYLKRLVVGGLDRVYEFARCFRNEGIDRDHNPEFTQVEFYAAYWDYKKLMTFSQEMLQRVVADVLGSTPVVIDGQTIDFSKPFTVLDYRQALIDKVGLDLDDYPDTKKLLAEAKSRHVEVTKDMGRGKIIDLIFKKFVRPGLIQPTFLINYPLDLSPLAKRHPDRPGYVERFQILVGGTELANAFSELNDPIDQRQRFLDQDKLREAGDSEAQRLDEDYLEALMVGLPPTAGFGMGIDRLAALLTGAANLKDVILFPALRPTTPASKPVAKRRAKKKA